MTQTPEDNEQIQHGVTVVAVGILLIFAGLFLSTFLCPDDDPYQMIRFMLRAGMVSILGLLCIGGVYVGIDWIIPGSLSQAILKGNMAAAIFAAACILGSVMLLFAS